MKVEHLRTSRSAAVRRAGLAVMRWLVMWSALCAACGGAAIGAEAPQASRAPQAPLWLGQNGHVLVGELGCTNCHAAGPAANRLLAAQAPNLSEVGARATPQYLRRFLTDPHHTKPGTSMPDMLHGQSPAQRDASVEALVHYLSSLGGPIDLRAGKASVSQVAWGEALYHSVGCVACHEPMARPAVAKANTAASPDKELDPTDAIVPQLSRPSAPLGDLAGKTTVAALAAFLKDPLRARPAGRMPSLNLAADEATAIAAYLLHRQPSQDSGDVAPGLNYAFYDGRWTDVPDLSKLIPTHSGVAERVDLNDVVLTYQKLDTRKPRADFAVRFTGFVDVPADGYTLRGGGDDFLVVRVDGRPAIDTRSKGGKSNPTCRLSAGQRAIDVVCVQTGGGMSARLDWQAPDDKNFKSVPSQAFKRPVRRFVPTGAGPLVVDEQKAARGRALFSSLGCASCHSTEPVAVRAASDTLPGYAELKLDNAVGFARQNSNWPANESPAHAIDGKTNTKYLNFAKEGSGLTVTLRRGPDTVAAISLTSANDSPERDPAAYLLEGSSDGKTFTKINQRTVPPFGDRFTTQSFTIHNDKAFAVYRLTFTALRNPASAGAVQVAEVKLYASLTAGSTPLVAMKAKPLAQLDPAAAGGCLSDSVSAGRPLYAMTAAQRSALRSAVAELKQPGAALAGEALVQRTMAAFNCYACHNRGGQGGPDPGRARYFVTTVPVDLGDEGRLPPALDLAGAKLSINGLQGVLFLGQRMRPHMATRMPQFGPANLDHLPLALAAADEGSFPPRRPLITGRNIDIGRQLVGVQGLGCINCHRWGQFDSLGVPGANLADVAARLNPAWFHAWLHTPNKLRVNTRMPTFFPDGKSVRKDILDGDMTRQIDAIWAYLSVGVTGGAPLGMAKEGDRLNPKDEPIVFRTFVADVSAYSILVGFPEMIHVVFDANHVRMAKAWSGSFVTTKQTWDGRGGQYVQIPARDVLAFPAAPSLALLASDSAPWPADKPRARMGADHTPDGWRFCGYRFDKARVPTFLYNAGPLRVEETPSVKQVGDKASVTRRLRITSDQNISGWRFLAATGASISESNGVFLIDKRVSCRIQSRATPIIRDGAAGKELIVPVTLDAKGQTTIVVEMMW